MGNPKYMITRRELIKQFGLTAFLLTPILRSMEAMGAVSLSSAPRYLQLFKGGGCLPEQYMPSSMDNFSGKIIESMQSLSSDMVLFKNMTMSSGYKDEDGGYGDEHGGGTAICFTGGRVHCWDKTNGNGSGSDSYGWEGWDISLDQKIAEYYKTVPGMTTPFDSFVIGVGLHSQARCQIYISTKQGQPNLANKTGNANAVPPIGDPSVLYTKMFDRLLTMCGTSSNQPTTTNNDKLAILNRKKSIVDFQLDNIKSAKTKFGMDSEHSHKLDAMLDALSETEKSIGADIIAAQSGGGGQTPVSSKACPTMTKPAALSSTALNSVNIDSIDTRYDQFNQLVKLAFEWDLTRVVSYIFATGSNSQSYPGGGAPDNHHVYAHNSVKDKTFIIDKYHYTKIGNLLKLLKGTTDSDGKSVLYNTSMVLGLDTWGAGAHNRTNMPFMLAGQGGGKFKTGRIIDVGGRNQNDLLISVMNASGINETTFGKAQYCKGPLNLG